jgi:hypothetical protein
MSRLLPLLALLAAGPATASVTLNEFMARNRGAHTNAAGDDRADWIELRNAGAQPVDLTGWHLTDDFYNPAKWVFPATVLSAGGYLVVYATSSSQPVVAGQLHTNFALGTDGEYLALVGPDGVTVVDAVTVQEFLPGQFGYPPQLENVSYGRDVGQNWVFFNASTPGAINAGGASDFVADTRFSHDRGFYSAPFDLVITTSTPGAEIRYTTNGSPPDATSPLYTGPLRISGTTCVRARAFKAGLYPTNIDTHTYLFVADIVRQSSVNNTPPTPEWPSYNVNGQVMQYGLDPDITGHPAYTNLIDDALLAVPTFSVVTDLDHLFDATSGIYVNADREGELWERVTSVELIHPDGAPGFQEDAGLRIRGGASRSDGNPKHAFRLRFRREYGAARLHYPLFGEDGATSFNGIDLRCSQTPSWHLLEPGNHTELRDIFSRDLQLACGQPSTRGFHFHLYLNGVYWGLYETQEKIEGDFAADYLGGEPEDYDVINKKKHGYSIDGSADLYTELWNLTQFGYGTYSNYFRVQGLDPDGVTRNPAYPKLVDLENLMDYMLITYYTGEKDGPASVWAPVNNYLAVINRVNPDGLKHFEYDSEWSLGIGLENVVGPINRSQWTQLTHFNGHYLHERLVQNPEYRLAFADRAHKYFFNNGLMTPAQAIPLLERRAQAIDVAIIAESARWGDALNDSLPHTRNDHWVPAVNAAKTWLQNRTPTVLQQLRNAGWYPSVNAPVFNQHGGQISAGFALTLSGPGTLVYTLDGSDPRESITGAIRGQTYSGPLSLPHGVVVKARALSGGVWSALNEAVFHTDAPNTLRISEVMFHPRLPSGAEFGAGASRDDFEFVEIHNAGPVDLGLAGVTLRGRAAGGVSFDFTGSAVTHVPAHGHVLVVRDPAAFALRYPTPGLLIAGAYRGSLDNLGDTLELVSASGEVLSRFTYEAGREWPLSADGAGHSLVPRLLNTQTGPALSFGGNWRASAFLDGSPGQADPEPAASARLNEVESNTTYSNPTPPYDTYTGNDGIELFNPAAAPLSLNEWYLSDDADNLWKWRIPDGTTLPAQGWRWFSQVQDFNFPPGTGFAIGKSGETIFLSHLPLVGPGRVVDAVALKAQAAGTSWSRLPDGDGHWATAVPTPDAANTRAAASLVISEIMRDPPGDGDLEYLEICNVSAQAVPLFESGIYWRLDGGVDFAFPSHATLAPGQCLAVVSFDPADPLQAAKKAAFLAAYRQFDGETLLYGPYSGKLGNDFDRIALERPLPPDGPGESPSWILVDEVTYTRDAPWPAGTDGTGASWRRRVVAASGNDPTAWATADLASPGLPNRKLDFLQPASGATLLLPQLATATLGLDSSQIVGPVQHVTFLLDGQTLGVDPSPPYQFALTPAHLPLPGSYTLQARLRDAEGDHLSRPIPVQVEFADRVTLRTPVDGQGFIPPYTAELIADVREDLVLGAVSQVEFFRDGLSLGVDTTPPYTWVIDQPTSAGSHALTAVMTDAFASSTSRVVNIHIHTQAPIVDLTALPDHTLRLGDDALLHVDLDLNGLPPELVTVEWTLRSGPGAVTFADPDSPSTTASFSAPGVYEIELVVRHGTHRQSVIRTLTVAESGLPSTVRFAEDFESYLPGSDPSALGGWSSSGDEVTPRVVATNYPFASPGVFPISYAAHTQALRIDGPVTNTFSGTQGFTNLWIDSVCQMVRWRNPTPPATRDSAHLQLYVNADGHLRVWHKPDPVQHPSSNAWVTLPGVTLADGAFHRLTVHADYQRDAGGNFHFALYLDGAPIPQAGFRFASANTNQAHLSRLVMSGPFHLDDLVVDTRDPFTSLYLLRASAGPRGAISPSVDVFVEAGGSQAYAITPDQFFHVADVLVNEVSMGAVTHLDLTNVTQHAQIRAVFAPDRTASGTPHWWLHAQNPAWSADFEAADLGNPDGDALATWQEFVAGTHPGDDQSLPWLVIDQPAPARTRLEFPAHPERRYRLQRKIGGLQGPWADVLPPFLGQPGPDGWMTVELPQDFDRVYYRIGVDLP